MNLINSLQHHFHTLTPLPEGVECEYTPAEFSDACSFVREFNHLRRLFKESNSDGAVLNRSHHWCRTFRGEDVATWARAGQGLLEAMVFKDHTWYRLTNKGRKFLGLPPISKGFVAALGCFEFFHDVEGNLCRADLSSPIAPDGYRQGARFECTPRQDGHAAYLQDAYSLQPYERLDSLEAPAH